MKRNHFSAIAVATVLCAAISTSQAAEKTAFKVCADPLNPPYSTKKQEGFENKIAELFAKELGQKLEYTWFPQRIGFIRNTLTAPVKENEVDSQRNPDEMECNPGNLFSRCHVYCLRNMGIGYFMFRIPRCCIGAT